MITSAGNQDAIREMAMDYIEGWFEGDAARMARCLHQNLAKRSLRYDPEAGETRFYHLTREDMIKYTEDGGGKDIERDKVYYKVDILASDDDMAVVRVESYGYLDYLQSARIDGQWQIVNILYTRTLTS